MNIEKHRHWLAFMVLIAVPISGLNVDIIAPSLPAITQYFNVDKMWVQLLITLGTIGFAIAVLIFASISDQIGRKKPFLVALLIYILVTFLAPHSRNITELLFLRLIQGLTIGCFVIPLRAILSDLYVDKAFLKMMTYLAMAWAIGPIIAPVIGGYLQHYFGWHAPFYFLTIYATLLWLLNIIFVPETLHVKKSLMPKEILANYSVMLKNRDFIIGFTMIGILYSMILLFALAGPFLIQTVLHYSAIAFGHMALLMGIALLLGNISSRWLIDVDFELKILVCFILSFVTAFCMVLSSWCLGINIYFLIIPIFILFYLGGIAYPAYYGRTLALFPNFAGTANGLCMGLNCIICSLITAIAAILKSKTALPLSFIYLTLSVICLLLELYRRNLGGQRSAQREAHSTSA